MNLDSEEEGKGIGGKCLVTSAKGLASKFIIHSFLSASPDDEVNLKI